MMKSLLVGDEMAEAAQVLGMRRPPLSRVMSWPLALGLGALLAGVSPPGPVAAQPAPTAKPQAGADAQGRDGDSTDDAESRAPSTEAPVDGAPVATAPADHATEMPDGEATVDDGVLESAVEDVPDVGPIYDGPIEGIAALVGAEVPGPTVTMILHSDVDLRARLALLRGRPTNLPLQPLPTSVLSAALEELIGEALLLREAERVRLGEPGRAEVRAERARIVEASGGEARIITLLRALEAPPEALDRMAERRATVVRFMQASLEGTASVTDAQVARVYESGAHPFVGHELDDIREPLRSWISQSMLQRAVRRWIRALSSRTPVKRVARYAKEP